MNTVTKSVSMFLLSVLIMMLLVTIALGFMLGFSHPLPWILIGVLVIIPFIHDKIISRRFVQWNDDMSVGIELVDQDHKKLLGLINQLQASTQYQTDDQLIEKTLDELLDYTKYHFTREEELMRLNQYPGYEAHRQLHESMIKNVSQYIDEYRVNKTRTVEQVLSFLKTWLMTHIKGCDREYMPFLKIKDLDNVAK